MYQIDKDIPIPAHISRDGKRSRKPKYPWVDLNIGDSFFTPLNANAASSIVFAANKRYPQKKFIYAKDGSGNRIWRLK